MKIVAEGRREQHGGRNARQGVRASVAGDRDSTGAAGASHRLLATRRFGTLADERVGAAEDVGEDDGQRARAAAP